MPASLCAAVQKKLLALQKYIKPPRPSGYRCRSTPEAYAAHIILTPCHNLSQNIVAAIFRDNMRYYAISGDIWRYWYSRLHNGLLQPYIAQKFAARLGEMAFFTCKGGGAEKHENEMRLFRLT